MTSERVGCRSGPRLFSCAAIYSAQFNQFAMTYEAPDLAFEVRKVVYVSWLLVHWDFSNINLITSWHLPLTAHLF